MSTQRYSATPHPIETLLTCDDFLKERLKLMALKVKTGFGAL